MSTLIGEMTLISQSMFGWLRMLLFGAVGMMGIVALVVLIFAFERKPKW